MLRVPKEHDPADAHRDRDRRVDSNTLADLKLVRSSESFLTDQGPEALPILFWGFLIIIIE